MSQLARKYRPATFEEMAGAGNILVAKAIKSILGRKREDVPHTFLLTGMHGCGKTTLGRIIARELGCHGMDYKEVDSADARGIDAIREIRKSVAFPPMEESECRIWLLDECHQITKDGKEDLLKVTEEPPEHVYFILCTTNPQELSSVLRSRCVTFEVQGLTEDEMTQLLREIVIAEHKRVPDNVLRQIATDSLGSCRDALQILEKVIDLPRQDMLEVAKQTAAANNEVIELCRILLTGTSKDWLKVTKILKGLEKENPEKIRQSMLGYSKAILMKEDNAKAFLIMDSFLRNPFYGVGNHQVIYTCYAALNT